MGISRVAEQVVASQEGLGSMELAFQRRPTYIARQVQR
jgi:hypothetical protein